jgi:hypothetical protein
MQFAGAQTWLLYPGLDMLWGDVDQKWIDRGFDISTPKTLALMEGMNRNRMFMKECATIEIVNTPKQSAPGEDFTFTVRVTNTAAGHKLPTGYGEGRQMWIHVQAVDVQGNVVFEDGMLNTVGSLQRTALTKVYEQKIEADGYDGNVLADGFNILDADKDGTVTHEEKEFHFVLLNKIVKDNRIPPRGFNKAAYQADGAFIVPADTYADGQNWDDTSYTFSIPGSEKIRIRATLYYQTFNKQYIDFLDHQDVEPTESNGGRARDLPQGGVYADFPTWGSALKQLWSDVGNGPPVEMGVAEFEVDPTLIHNTYDINADCIISNFELLNAIDDWVVGGIDNFFLLDLIALWANSPYCTVP